MVMRGQRRADDASSGMEDSQAVVFSRSSPTPVFPRHAQPPYTSHDPFSRAAPLTAGAAGPVQQGEWRGAVLEGQGA